MSVSRRMKTSCDRCTSSRTSSNWRPRASRQSSLAPEDHLNSYCVQCAMQTRSTVVHHDGPQLGVGNTVWTLLNTRPCLVRVCFTKLLVEASKVGELGGFCLSCLPLVWKRSYGDIFVFYFLSAGLNPLWLSVFFNSASSVVTTFQIVFCFYRCSHFFRSILVYCFIVGVFWAPS